VLDPSSMRSISLWRRYRYFYLFSVLPHWLIPIPVGGFSCRSSIALPRALSLSLALAHVHPRSLSPSEFVDESEYAHKARGCMHTCMCSYTLSFLNAPACTHTSLSHANANALFDAFQEVREKDEDGDPEGARMVRGRLVQGKDRKESKKDK
jgi:hypothetical protein